MKAYISDTVRNVALVAHQGVGKTTLTEALLFDSGVISRMGDVAQGNTTSDFADEEQRRGLSLSTSIIPIETNGLKLNFLDTPGYTDFQGEVKNALRVSDLALVILDASTGVQVGTEVYAGFAEELGVPRLFLINKMNRENARRPRALLDEMEEIYGGRFVPVQLPVGQAENFEGVIDLLTMRAYTAEGVGEIPADLVEAAEAARFELMEAAAEADDVLLEKYFDEGELADEDIIEGVRLGLKNGAFTPVAFAAATEGLGVAALAELIAQVAPTPCARCYEAEGAKDTIYVGDGKDVIYVFKTHADPYVGSLTYFRVLSGTVTPDTRYYNHTRDEEERFGSIHVMRGQEQLPVDVLHAGDIGTVAKLNVTMTGDTLGDADFPVTLPLMSFPQPIYAVAVSPVNQSDSAKMGPTLTRLCDEDHTLQWHQDPVTNEIVMEGMGDMHIAVTIKRAEHLGTNLCVAIPRVPYRESISGEGVGKYRHKKQTGGAGQFGEVHLRVEPLPEGSGFEFESKVFGGAISSAFLPSIEKGIRGVLEEGVVAGYPVVDVRAVVFDGKEHPVDSKDIAFQVAGREAFKLAVQDANPVLLEPVVKLTVTVPESDMGSVISDLSSRRGHVENTDIVAGKAIVTACVPLANVQRYSNDLRSFTQGRGVYTLEFDSYQKVPAHVMDEVIEAARSEE